MGDAGCLIRVGVLPHAIRVRLLVAKEVVHEDSRNLKGVVGDGLRDEAAGGNVVWAGFEHSVRAVRAETERLAALAPVLMRVGEYDASEARRKERRGE